MFASTSRDPSSVAARSCALSSNALLKSVSRRLARHNDARVNTASRKSQRLASTSSMTASANLAPRKSPKLMFEPDRSACRAFAPDAFSNGMVARRSVAFISFAPRRSARWRKEPLKSAPRRSAPFSGTWISMHLTRAPRKSTSDRLLPRKVTLSRSAFCKEAWVKSTFETVTFRSARPVRSAPRRFTRSSGFSLRHASQAALPALRRSSGIWSGGPNICWKRYLRVQGVP